MKLRILSALFAVLLTPGCVMVQLGVTNPIVGLTTVAVTPFLNLSAERATDGRRFALTYASELQKVPGFEVLPVGVTEVAMIDAKIDLNDADDVLKLAKILGADAVVVGAVTEYSPYYPPRIGMQVNWYSPKTWSFYPGIQTEPATRGQLKEWDRERRQDWRDNQKQIEAEKAPETPVWMRMYHCFKRWPGVRTLYGEPTLSLNDETLDAVWRAQSPALSDGQIQTLTKTAHYQESQGDGAVTRIVMTPSDLDVPTPGVMPPLSVPGGDSPANPAPSDPKDLSRPNAEPPKPGVDDPVTDKQPEPLPMDMPPLGPPAPEGGKKSPFDLPLDASPFSPEPPALVPVPVSPVPIRPEADQLPGGAAPSMSPIRDPGTTPPVPQPNPFNQPQPVQPWQLDTHQPLMSYTRLFDGADGELVAALRDYVELNGDLRSGGWEGYLHRSEDFIRFTCYRMITEMLSLHGGEGRHRMILKFRKYR